MWSVHQQKVVRIATILRPSSIQHNYQGVMAWETITIFTIPYGFGSQHPILPPSLNDLNLPIQGVGYYGRDSSG